MGNSIKVPSTISVLKVNGVKFSSPFFPKEQTLSLKPGNNTLILQYEELFEDYENDDHSTVRSAPFIVMFNNKEKQEVRLSHQLFSDEKLARAFSEQPTVKLLTYDNQLLPVNIQNLESYLAQRASALLSIDDKSTLLKIDPPESETTDQYRHQNDPNKHALTMLKYWWAEASKEQRSKFKAHMNK